jgi:hypothetical protein
MAEIALISPLDQPLHHPPQLSGRVAGDHLDVADARPPQRFLLDRVASSGCVRALEMRGTLVLDRVQRPALVVHDQQVDAL